MRFFQTDLSDRIGFTASALCALHCALLPILATTLPYIGFQFILEEWFEIGVYSFTLVIAAHALYTQFQFHRDLRPGLTVAFGFLCMIVGHEMHTIGWTAIFAAIGGSCIALGHYLNIRLSQKAKQQERQPNEAIGSGI